MTTRKHGTTTFVTSPDAPSHVTILDEHGDEVTVPFEDLLGFVTERITPTREELGRARERPRELGPQINYDDEPPMQY
jgi:hypothetical protein